MAKRFVITGASGFVGRQLVPRLKSLGCGLLLVGRNPRRLAKLFPEVPNCSYDQIVEKARNYDALIHLAVLNSNARASAEEFQQVNVGLLSHAVAAAKAAGINVFVNVTTFHALNKGRSAYADSKRQALTTLDDVDGLSIVNLFLPAVYGDDFSGKLSIVKIVPSFIRTPALVALTALVPTLHVNRLASFLAHDLNTAEGEVMLANPQEDNCVYRWGKRTIDTVFSIAVIVLFGWGLLIIWALVRVTSQGSGLFAQQRIGQNRKPFICYKFRTMKVGTRQAGTHDISVDALTHIGTFLRKSKLDELPQVWNILRGELSLVGPRPSLPSQTALIAVREERGVLSVLPGITGLSQTKGIDMSDPTKLVQMDAHYVFQRGLLSEIKIILSTFIGRGRGDNVKA